MSVAPYVVLYLIPAAVSAALALYSWQRRQAQAAMPFSLLMAAVVFWSSCHALSAASSTLDAPRRPVRWRSPMRRTPKGNKLHRHGCCFLLSALPPDQGTFARGGDGDIPPPARPA